VTIGVRTRRHDVYILLTFGKVMEPIMTIRTPGNPERRNGRTAYSDRSR